jgi:hypothetical protein
VDLVLDDSAHVDAVEIKSGRTIGSDFFRGLEFYGRLGKTYVRDQELIYGGLDTYNSRGVSVRSYVDLATT